MTADTPDDARPPHEPRTLVQPRLAPTARACPEVRWRDARGEHRAALVGRLVVGSAAGVDVQVDDPAVSRLHAELHVREDGVWVRDLGSRNGTFVEGVQVALARVPDEGQVRLGASTALHVVDGAAAAEVPSWPADHFGPLVGGSAVMRELYGQLARVAAADAPVLVHGETGTGKELVAQAIHDASPRGYGGFQPPPGGKAPRTPGPFVVVDCAALPENLLESELFGHVRGAFTGAVATRVGAFEMAQGGTLFLDEVGELPLAMQPKLLRVLESRTIRRVGEGAFRPVDFRLVAATHRDLREMVNQGAFREDLYFRLAVLPIEVPPLRARLDDVPALVARFLGGGAPAAPELIAELSRRPWLGNVRELRNAVERARVLGAAAAVASLRAPSVVPPPPPPSSPSSMPPAPPAIDAPADNPDGLPPAPIEQPFKEVRERWLDFLERDYVQRIVAKHHGNVSAAAQAAGLDRSYIYRILRRHDL